jgi:hypothetical protein
LAIQGWFCDRFFGFLRTKVPRSRPVLFCFWELPSQGEGFPKHMPIPYPPVLSDKFKRKEETAQHHHNHHTGKM